MATTQNTPADAAGFARFQTELARLVARFEKDFKLYQSPTYSEASVRQDFLDPLFAALGWDIGNKCGLIPQHREVEIESRTEVAGRQKRADYLFRTDRTDRFVCEAKKPVEKLHAGYAFQAKRYAWNKNLVLAVLSDFEEIKIYLVGARPHLDDPDTGHFQTWHYLEYAKHAADIWNLLSREAVAGGAIEKLVAALPRRPVAKTKAKQQWLFKPDRARAIDADFLDFLDEARRELASDLIRHNDRADLLEGTRLDEAVQRILDRLLFLRICEDRDIDTGRPLANILKAWRDRAENPPPRKLRAPALPLHEAAAEYAPAAKPAPPESLWREIVAHFRALDRRPASHIPYFNGNLFKEHFSESLAVSDEWISGFLDEIGDDASPYLFNVIPVEILGTIYERFLGKTVRPHGRGVTIEEKPEVRKAGGVYYTPRYIVDYIVEQTLGKLLADKPPAESLKLRVLDPACGSGSFLIRAYERLCEHWQTALIQNDKLRRKTDCWTDPDTGDLHLTTDLKRRILTANIYGVDLDPGAVEVTQLSLYLKMLEGESRATLAKNRELFGSDTPLLPPLQDNIKCGNSLIASDFSLNPDDLVRVRAFDWNEGFREIMKAGGFDVVIGNPPWGVSFSDEEKLYFDSHYRLNVGKYESYVFFIERASALLRPAGYFGNIFPSFWISRSQMGELRRHLMESLQPITFVLFPENIFSGVQMDACVLTSARNVHSASIFIAEIGSNELEKCQNTSFILNKLERVEARDWNEMPRTAFNPRIKANDVSIIRKVEHGRTRLDNLVEITQGLTLYRRSTLAEKFGAKKAEEIVSKRLFHADHKKDKTFKKELLGKDVDRYDAVWNGGSWVSYGPWLAHAVDERFFKGPRLVIQKIRNPALTQRLVVGFLDDDETYSAGVLLNIIARSKGVSLPYIMAMMNSRLLNFWYRKCVLDVSIRVVDLEQLPIAGVTLEGPTNQNHYDKLASLAKKMLSLVPKLRSAKSETERSTLANAVAATDRAIDALVYELYGLTPDEIALVEGAAK